MSTIITAAAQYAVVHSLVAAVRAQRDAAFAAKDAGAHAAAEGNYFPKVDVGAIRELVGDASKDGKLEEALALCASASDWSEVNDRRIAKAIFATKLVGDALQEPLAAAYAAKHREEEAARKQDRRAKAADERARGELFRWIRNLHGELRELTMQAKRPFRAELPELVSRSTAELEQLHRDLLTATSNLKKELADAWQADRQRARAIAVMPRLARLG